MKKLLIALILGLGCSAALAKTDLPLKQVVLFNSGVGYFERVADVTDADTAELQFTKDQINDVIKSLVLVDESGGGISAVTYDSRDPVDRTLKSFRVDLTDNPDLALLLNRMRGLSVRVKTGAQSIEGRIVGVERKQVTEDERVFEKSQLNLLGSAGLSGIALEAVQNITVLDAKTSADLEKALAVLAASQDREKKGVRLAFTGKSQRKVHVGYMLETPLWRTSYRLVIGEKKTLLQGWAHVENATDEDWNQVTLSLVAGRPLSFIQDLYNPLYIQRPVVEEETYGAIVPPSYDQSALADAVAAELEEPPAERAYAERRKAGRAMLPAAPMAAPAMMMEDLAVGGMGGGVESQATAQEAGELFQYAVKEPVTLPRQQSAMIPIVNQDIKGEALSIFNESVNERFPLNGVELENTSDLYLMRGPVTVFEDGVYAGDGRLADTRQGEKRMVSYALDLACEADVKHQNEPEEILALKIVRGLLQIQRKYVEVTGYSLKNKRAEARPLLVEHPRRPGWDLVEPKEAEKTADFYRFRLDCGAGKTEEVKVKVQMLGQQEIVLSNMDEGTIGLYLRQKAITPAVREALTKLARLQQELANTRVRREALNRRVREIAQDQNRIRENMKTVARGSDSYTRWEKKLGDQESELDQINDQIEKAVVEERIKGKEIDDFLAGLNAE